MTILAKLTIVGCAALLAAASPVATASAKETLIGSPCAAEGASPSEGGTILPLSLGTNHNNRDEVFFAEAPHGGLLTSWTVVIGYETKPFLLRRSVAGKVGDRHRYYIAQQTEPKVVRRGVNFFHTRLWIVKGETIALASVGDRIPFCSTTSVRDAVGISLNGLYRDESGAFGPALGRFTSIPPPQSLSQTTALARHGANRKLPSITKGSRMDVSASISSHDVVV